MGNICSCSEDKKNQTYDTYIIQHHRGYMTGKRFPKDRKFIDVKDVIELSIKDDDDY